MKVRAELVTSSIYVAVFQTLFKNTRFMNSFPLFFVYEGPVNKKCPPRGKALYTYFYELALLNDFLGCQTIEVVYNITIFYGHFTFQSLVRLDFLPCTVPYAKITIPYP